MTHAERKTLPPNGGLLGRDFSYTRHENTDIRKTFDRARAAQAQALAPRPGLRTLPPPK